MSTVGRSDRTPAKHELMSRLYGREVGAATCNPGIRDLIWYDLTAGDAVAGEAERHWHRSCSPGILAHHARWERGDKSTRVLLYEQAPNTYRQLLANLAEQLPALGYKRPREDEWTAHEGRVVLRAINADGATADLSLIGPHSAVMVSNDPNKISDWAMPEEMPRAIREITPWFLGISTMGCNVGGLKRFDLDERKRWYGHVQSVTSGLPRYQDLYLAAIENDASQWAYLVASPRKTGYRRDWRGDTENAARSAFDRHGMALRSAWLREDRPAFTDICHDLFLTRNERKDR